MQWLRGNNRQMPMRHVMDLSPMYETHFVLKTIYSKTYDFMIKLYVIPAE